MQSHICLLPIYIWAVFTPSSPYLFWLGALRGRTFCRELRFTMLCLPSIIHSLWFLSNLSLIVLVQLKRQSEFLLHHQYNLQLISICVHYHAPFGFSSVSINNTNKNRGHFCVHACVCVCVLVSGRVTAALFHFSQLVLATLDPALCRLSWLLPRLISWCLTLKSWKQLKWTNPYASSRREWTLLLTSTHISMVLQATCSVLVECGAVDIPP